MFNFNIIIVIYN